MMLRPQARFLLLPPEISFRIFGGPDWQQLSFSMRLSFQDGIGRHMMDKALNACFTIFALYTELLTSGSCTLGERSGAGRSGATLGVSLNALSVISRI